MSEDSLDLKIVFLGAASVGKTCLIHRYCNNRFQEDTINTIGAGFFTHSLAIDDNEVTLLLWDTSGEERFRSVAPSLLRGANGLVLVYDLTEPQTLDDASIYLEMFLDTVIVDMGCDLPVLLLGNKLDVDKPQIDEQVVQDFCEKNRIVLHNKVSAKTGQGVAESIDKLVHTILTPGRSVGRQPLQLTPVPVQDSQKYCC